MTVPKKSLCRGMCRIENSYNHALFSYLLDLRAWDNQEHSNLCPLIHSYCGTRWICCNLDQYPSDDEFEEYPEDIPDQNW